MPVTASLNTASLNTASLNTASLTYKRLSKVLGIPVLKSRKKKTAEPLAPDVLAHFLKRATEQHGAGQLGEAARLYHHVMAQNPDALAAPYFLGLIEVELGHLEDALSRFRLVTMRDPRSFEAAYCLAYVLEELERWPQALEAWRRAARLRPALCVLQFKIVKALEVLGRIDEAVDLARGMSKHPAYRLRALQMMALMRARAISEDEFGEIESAYLAERDVESGSVSTAFVMGELYELRQRYDEAFAAFALGNARKHAQLRQAASGEAEPEPVRIAPPASRLRDRAPDAAAAAHQQQCDEVMAQFDAAFLARLSGSGLDTPAPIFIVGMPRSGSTLLEQIISAHPKVEGLGEVSALALSLRKHGGRGGPAGVSHLTAADIGRMAQAYLQHMRDLGWRKGPFFIDKMLANYMHIGFIHLMFPRATIIHAMRDPVETCFGGFRKSFARGNETTYALADIAAQYRRYRMMLAHWDRVLPGRVAHVSHEALISDPESEIRKLVVETCGLKWDEACLDFHRSKRAVRTASITQVRQPIFRSSMDRWRKYETHLAPLLQALGPYAPRA